MLPLGWEWATLSDVCEINPKTDTDHLPPNAGLTFVPMAAVEEELGRIDVSIHRPLRDVAKGFTRFRLGDVIFAKITPCMENGKIRCREATF